VIGNLKDKHLADIRKRWNDCRKESTEIKRIRRKSQVISSTKHNYWCVLLAALVHIEEVHMGTPR
jgi:hypothetical protein